jgi:hypothetical protein
MLARARPRASRFAGKALDVGLPGGEQAQVMLVAPARELAQVQLIGLPVRPV